MKQDEETTAWRIENLLHYADSLLNNVEKVIVGKRPVIELLFIAMLCEGHVLIEDIPGTGKTMLARAIAISTGLEYKRIQCTPDLLPGDVTGVSIFNQKTREFEFKPGPIFCNILLADEINRATPRTQSAFLEAMGEGHVTVDGKPLTLPKPFILLATQNPIEYEGTFPLPEAQMDRFLFRLKIGYPQLAAEDTMLVMQQQSHPINSLEKSVQGFELTYLQKKVRQVHVAGSIRRYILDLVQHTRSHPALTLGVSPRGSLALYHASQAHAALRGRDYVIPDDVKEIVPACLAHRMILNPEFLLDGSTTEIVLRDLLRSIEVPLE
jgi:MoxR-like ATPase